MKFIQMGRSRREGRQLSFLCLGAEGQRQLQQKRPSLELHTATTQVGPFWENFFRRELELSDFCLTA